MREWLSLIIIGTFCICVSAKIKAQQDYSEKNVSTEQGFSQD